MAIGNNRGGRKKGGGRQSDLAKALKSSTTNPDISGYPVSHSGAVLSTLEPQKQLFVHYMVRFGYGTRVAEMLGISEATVANWKRETWFAPACQEVIDRYVADPIATFAPMLPEAIQTYQEKLSERDRETARDVFDRLHGKPIVRSQSIGDYTVNIVIKKASEGIEAEAKIIE